MAVRQRKNVDYGFTNALQTIPPQPIIALQDPTTADYAEIGTLWVNKSSDNYFILTSISAGSANWEAQSGGDGNFTEVNVNPGNIEVDAGDIIVDAGDIDVTAGSITAGASISAGTSLSATTTITAGTGITATTGNIVATTGNITTAAGNIGSAGFLLAGTTVTGGTGVIATTGDITATTGNFVVSGATASFRFGTTGPQILFGTGSPDTVVTATQGSIFLRTDGAADTTLYVNTNGTTAWTALTST